MYGSFDLSTLMPVLGILFVLIIIVVLIVVLGKSMQVKYLAINQKSFEDLAGELKADNQALREELAAMKETLNSIDRMMKEID